MQYHKKLSIQATEQLLTVWLYHDQKRRPQNPIGLQLLQPQQICAWHLGNLSRYRPCLPALSEYPAQVKSTIQSLLHPTLLQEPTDTAAIGAILLGHTLSYMYASAVQTQHNRVWASCHQRHHEQQASSKPPIEPPIWCKHQAKHLLSSVQATGKCWNQIQQQYQCHGSQRTSSKLYA